MGCRTWSHLASDRSFLFSGPMACRRAWERLSTTDKLDLGIRTALIGLLLGSLLPLVEIPTAIFFWPSTECAEIRFLIVAGRLLRVRNGDDGERAPPRFESRAEPDTWRCGRPPPLRRASDPARRAVLLTSRVIAHDVS